MDSVPKVCFDQGSPEPRDVSWTDAPVTAEPHASPGRQGVQVRLAHDVRLRGGNVIAVENYDRYVTQEYRRLYHALGEVDEAVRRLRALLPEPGARVHYERAKAISDAEQDFVAQWVRYFRAYVEVHPGDGSTVVGG